VSESSSKGQSSTSAVAAESSHAPDAAPRVTRGEFWTRVCEHKVLQWVLAYLGAALAIAHGGELLGHTFQWPELANRILMGVLIVGLPVVLALAWYHGHRGLKSVGAGELTIVALLLLIGAILLIALMRVPREEAAEAARTSIAKSGEAPARGSVASAPVAHKLRIAVMPFENLSPEPANAFFADGLQEEVLTDLANSTSGLEVISRTTMMSYKGKPVTVQQIAKELGCTHVLEGSVRREGDEVRLTLQLIDAKSDQHLWSQNFDRKLQKAMTLQSEVGAEVASRLSVQLTGGARSASAAPTTDPVAYDLYLKARLAAQELNGASSPQDRRRVGEIYTAAIARDPQFGLAYLGRARAGPGVLIEDALGWVEVVRLIRNDVAMARRLMGDDPRVVATEAGLLGFTGDDMAGAVRLFEAAEAKGLNDPAALVDKCSALLMAGRMDEALALSERLAGLDPGNPAVLLNWSANLWLAKKPEQALRVTDLLLARWPAERRDYWEGYRSDLIFMFSGNDRSATDVTSRDQVPTGMDAGMYEGVRIWHLRLSHRYTEIKQILDREPGRTMRGVPVFQSYALAMPPLAVAEERGWIDLLLRDRAAAKADGVATLALVDELSPPELGKSFDWAARLRAARGQLFIGDNAKAAEKAREALALMPRSRNAVLHGYAISVAAAVLAWAGDKDAATAALTELADSVPGAAPVTITRDPVYTVPLGNHAGYQKLRGRLEGEMAGVRLE
jgi:TolB-like protein